MRFWRLLIFFILICSTQRVMASPAPSQTKYARLSTDSIDKINTLAKSIYLADPTRSRKLAGSALVASKLINYQNGIGQSCLNIAAVYWSQSYYPISLLYIDTALRYFSKNDKIMYANCYCYMGRIYADMKDYRAAAYFLERSRLAAGNDQLSQLDVVVEMSYLYYKQHYFDLAYHTTLKAMRLCRAAKAPGIEAILYSRIAGIYVAQQQYKKALGYCDTAISLSYQVNNKRLRAGSFVERSTILLKQHDAAGALQYAKQALVMGDTLGIMDFKVRSYLAIIAVYEAQHNDKQLLYYEKEFNAFQQQRNILDKKNGSQLLHDYFELNARLQEINLIKQNAERDRLHIRSQQQVITILAICLLLLATGLYIVWFYYREKNTLARKLRDQYIATLAQSQIIEKQSHDLEELNLFKSKLLAIIGHDLRSPINNLRSVTDMFAEGSFSAEEVQLLMKNLDPVVKGAELTLSNLLVWADGQIRGIKGIQTVPVNLLHVIEEAEEICRPSLDKKHIRIQHNAIADSVALVDENHLKVILSNLIGNAIKFTEDDGNIAITVSREGEKIVICITDTGIGMSADEMEKLLSINTHFTKPGTQGEKGTGIGLLLCRELIELNGGKLWLNSQVGKGTSFYFNLPAANLQVA